MNKTLHIVSFANPLPADYGGAIEVYYKLKALNELGIKIIFHVFLYGKQKKDHRLNQYCYQVYYYKRNNSILKLLSFLPYIVVSRKNKAFLDRVSQDDFPILLKAFIQLAISMILCSSIERNSLEWLILNQIITQDYF